MFADSFHAELQTLAHAIAPEIDQPMYCVRTRRVVDSRDTLGNRAAVAGRVIHELCHHLPFKPIADEHRHADELDLVRVIQQQ